MPQAIAATPPELCMIYSHKWPAPFLFGAAMPYEIGVKTKGTFLLISPEWAENDQMYGLGATFLAKILRPKRMCP